jgi:hypothetical protein
MLPRNLSPLVTVPAAGGWYRCSFRLRGITEASLTTSFTVSQASPADVQYGTPLSLVGIENVRSEFAPDWTLDYADATPDFVFPNVWNFGQPFGSLVINRMDPFSPGLYWFERTIECSIAAGQGGIVAGVAGLNWSKQVTTGTLELLSQGGDPAGDYNSDFPTGRSLGTSTAHGGQFLEFMKVNTHGHLPSLFDSTQNIVTQAMLDEFSTTIDNYQFAELKFMGMAQEASWRTETITDLQSPVPV